jgi:hypothetical protein
MKFSEKYNVWCVHPTQHTNYLDVIEWCRDRWGIYEIFNERDGSWSYCDGKHYELTRLLGRRVEVPDQRLYFSFKSQEDAAFFALRWA